MSSNLVGLRVVRGPDWKWDNQDGGEGHLGTVVGLSPTAPKRVVVIQWDHGLKANYRMGAETAYDLRIFDNATCGVQHSGYSCDNCREANIAGIRWKCTVCKNYDLCTACYMKDVHDTSHVFQRFAGPHSPPFQAPQRRVSARVDAKGIFPEATVVRSTNWKWADEDGGAGSTGTVKELKGWSDGGTVLHAAVRNAVLVSWTKTGLSQTCRLGHEGQVDVQYKTSASGGTYYRDHLPILNGEFTSDTPSNSNQNAKVTMDLNFKAGDKVRIELTAEVLKDLQEGHGGWVPQMSRDIGKVGTVQDVTQSGDVIVEYEPKQKWIVHPAALVKVKPIQVDDTVVIIEDLKEAKRLQDGHGGWNELMKLSLGKTGKVVDIDSDGDLRVKVNGLTWAFNPACCTLASDLGKKSGGSSDMSSFLQEELLDSLSKGAARRLKKSSGKTKRSSGATFKVGDAVTIITDNAKVKTLQEGHHGGYNVLMKTVLGKTGKVIRVYADGDPRVRIKGHKWKLNPACCRLATDVEREAMDPSDPSSCDDSSSDESSSKASSDDSSSGGTETSLRKKLLGLSESDLKKLLKMARQGSDSDEDAGSGSPSTDFKVNDAVRILDDYAKVKKLQKGHGGWNASMKSTLGRTGKVVLVYPNGVLRVEVEGHTWTFNPACCSPVAKT